jgi:hypothetical protein
LTRTFFEKDITPYETLEDYYSENDEDMWEFRRLSPQTTGLSVDVFVDDNQAYKHHNHPIWVYFRNTYNSDKHDYLPMLINEHPHIPLIQPKINISSKDVEEIKRFIIKNYLPLLQMSKEGSAKFHSIETDEINEINHNGI